MTVRLQVKHTLYLLDSKAYQKIDTQRSKMGFAPICLLVPLQVIFTGGTAVTQTAVDAMSCL